MSGKPLVSILIPCYNVEQYLRECLESVVNQTYKSLQIVIIDDGSTDNTFPIAQEYANKDSRIEVFHQDNQGVSPTRNNLMNKSKGEYILFVDSDDWIESEMVEYLIGLAIKHRAQMIMCDKVMNAAQPSTDSPIEIKFNKDEAIRDFLRHDYFVGSLWNKLISKKVIDDERFNEVIWYGEDALFCWKVLQRIDSVVTSTRQLYHYRDVSNSITRSRFGAKKLTGHKVWSMITDDVKEMWPQYYDLVMGTFARNDYYLLMSASQDSYPKDKEISELQKNVKRNFKYLKRLLKSDKKTLINALAVSYWYGYGRFYYKLYELRNRLFRT